jgi:transketolase
LSNNPSPSYLRIGKAGEPELHNIRGIFNGPLRVCEGRADTAIVATGSILKIAIEFALEQNAKSRPTVFSMPLIKPLSAEFLGNLNGFSTIITLEEHVKEGGLFSSLCEILPPTCAIYACFIPEDLKSNVGSQIYLREQAKLRENLDFLLNSQILD